MLFSLIAVHDDSKCPQYCALAHSIPSGRISACHATESITIICAETTAKTTTLTIMQLVFELLHAARHLGLLAAGRL